MPPRGGLLAGMKTNLSPLLAAGALGAVALLAGCASEPASHVVSAPPPLPPATPAAPAATVYTTPAPVAAATAVTTPTGTYAVPSPVGASSVVVMQAPPQAQREVPTARPSRDHVWVAGYWAWRNDRYEWTAGHWEIPPRAGAVWIPPRWQPEGTSWRFYEGYWD